MKARKKYKDRKNAMYLALVYSPLQKHYLASEARFSLLLKQIQTDLERNKNIWLCGH